jgi:transcriptional regulator with XRE-family HTH domain
MTTGRSLVADFLRARRESLQPEEVGLPRDANRRVPGLRREEVAELAGISAEYYVRLEQGRDHQPSEQVLASLGRALRLDDDGFAYLRRVSRAAPVAAPVSARAESPRPRVAASVRHLLDQWSHTPAYVSDSNHDVLCANAAARAMAPGYLEEGSNMLLSVFASADTAERSADWETAATALVDSLRFNGDPADPRLQEIVGTLSVRDRGFRRMWARQNPRPLISGVTPSFVDPLGWVEFNWQTLEVPGRRGHFLTTFFGPSGSRADAAIAYLAASISRDIAR